MTQVQIEGIQNPIEEVTSKIQQYFRSHGFKKEGSIDPYGVVDGDFAIEILGTINDLRVRACYQDYKPSKMVFRDLLALDERIGNVDVYRFLSDTNYRDELSRITLDPIYVQIDGQLMKTTIFDYVLYGARNIDYSRK